MTSTTTRTTGERAQRLIRAAFGGEDYDPRGDILTDVCSHGYVEPGYSLTHEDGVICFGNWNPKRWPREGDAPLTRDENVGPRLARALERVGADLEWYDEWTTCSECYKAFRTEGDSYFWRMYGRFIGDGYVCADCILSDLESYAEEYVNNSDVALTFGTSADLERYGWTQYPEDYYEHGWHPGQNDTPKEVTELIRRTHPEDEWDILFHIPSVGQFDIRFTSYVRPSDYEHEEDED